MPPETAAELGLMTGVPPFPADKLVNLGNWQDPPFSRWGFQHVRELIPTANISRGVGKPWNLPRAERDLDGLPLQVGRRAYDLPTFLDETYTDGILVLHRGKVVMERYLNGMRPETTHLLMSVSKSVTSAACGSLVADGVLSPADLVTRHIPELAGTSWDGCTVRHLLDMRAGTKFNEDYEDLDRRGAGVRADLPVAATRRPHAAPGHDGVLPAAREPGPARRRLRLPLDPHRHARRG